MLIRPFDLSRERILTVKEAAGYLRVSPKTVRRWIEVGVKGKGRREPVFLQATMAGAEYRTSLESLDRFSGALAAGCKVRQQVRNGIELAVASGADAVHQRAVRQLRGAGYGS